MQAVSASRWVWRVVWLSEFRAFKVFKGFQGLGFKFWVLGFRAVRVSSYHAEPECSTEQANK